MLLQIPLTLYLVDDLVQTLCVLVGRVAVHAHSEVGGAHDIAPVALHLHSSSGSSV